MHSNDSPDFEWIDDLAGVERVAQIMDTAPWVALDTESNSMFVYQERLCLLQINAGGRLFVLDPLGDDNPRAFLAPLRPSLERPDQPLLLHGGEYDVAVLKRELGLSVGGVFDTQQATVFLGWQRTGYASAVEAICDVKLGKGYAQHDWGQRPIEERALRYAIDDVVYLPRVAEQLRADIEAADLVEELQIANQAVMDAAPHDTSFKPESVYRVKNLRELSAEQHPRLFALHLWRNDLAKQLDMPAGRLLNDRTMVELARVDPKDVAGLRRVRLPGRIMRESEELLSVLAAARQAPPALPHRRSSPAPSRDERRRNDALRDWRKKEALTRGVPTHVVLPNAALDHLAREGATELHAVPQLGLRRIQRYAEVLRELVGTVGGV